MYLRISRISSIVITSTQAHDYQGAMENWGLIAGAKDALLLDPERSTQEAKMEVFFVQCHEVAHMWCVMDLCYWPPLLIWC